MLHSKVPNRKMYPHTGAQEGMASQHRGELLTNEKYKGDARLQKRFTTDYLTKTMKVNEGEVPQYYVENSHPAITPQNGIWYKANSLGAKRQTSTLLAIAHLQVRLSVVIAESSSAPRYGTPTVNTAVGYGNVTTSSKVTKNAPLPTSQRMHLRNIQLWH